MSYKDQKETLGNMINSPNIRGTMKKLNKIVDDFVVKTVKFMEMFQEMAEKPVTFLQSAGGHSSYGLHFVQAKPFEGDDVFLNLHHTGMFDDFDMICEIAEKKKQNKA